MSFFLKLDSLGPMKLQQYSSEIIPEFEVYSTEILVEITLNFSGIHWKNLAGIPFTSQWKSTEIPVVFHWNPSVVPIKSQCWFTEIPEIPAKFFRWVPLKSTIFHCIFGLNSNEFPVVFQVFSSKCSSMLPYPNYFKINIKFFLRQWFVNFYQCCGSFEIFNLHICLYDKNCIITRKCMILHILKNIYCMFCRFWRF